MFQIVRVTLDDNGDVIARRPLQPLFERHDHATLIACNEAAGLWGDYGYDHEHECWWASDGRDRRYRFAVEQIAADDMAA
jgi:hypothetical protein